MSRKLNEIKSSLSSQIKDAIFTAIAEKVHPSIKNTSDMQGSGLFTAMDRRSSGLHWSLEDQNAQRTWESPPKRVSLRKVVVECLERVR